MLEPEALRGRGEDVVRQHTLFPLRFMRVDFMDFYVCGDDKKAIF